MISTCIITLTKKKSFSGSIFVDSENNLNDDSNIVVYGHNMRNDTMFAQIKHFKMKISSMQINM